ncbi:HD domain-containing protein [Oribacterium sp. FC2011]|nr:HD domain-containing protein [Oribacterium sp. FC2011]
MLRHFSIVYKDGSGGESINGKGNAMSRLKELRKYIDKKLNKMEDEDKRTGAIAHLYGVSLAAQMIAKKRNLDPELAAMAAMLHDMHAYKTGSYDDHAHLGADYARNVLTKLELTTPEETEIICSAIYHHDDKLNVDGPMDEVLKDADVIHHCVNDLSKPIKEKEQARFDSIMKEFGIEA